MVAATNDPTLEVRMKRHVRHGVHRLLGSLAVAALALAVGGALSGGGARSESSTLERAARLDSLRAVPEPVWPPAFWADSLAAEPTAAVGSRAMVTTANGYATRAAVRVLERGGSVADAAVAAQFVLNVVEPQSSGIGGGCFILMKAADADVPFVIDGRETAPAAITENVFLDASGRATPYYPDRITGGLPVGVPGTLAAVRRLHERAGRLPWGELVAPAVDLARSGFPVSRRLHESIRDEAARLRRFEATRKVWFRANGEPLAEGTWLVQPDLARTLELIATEGPVVFYEGDIAEDIVDAVQSAAWQPGFMTRADLAAYRVVDRAPVHGTYRGYDVYGMGPPSSGGITLIETLNILEAYDLRSLQPGGAEAVHLILEAEKLAFADRNRYIGDDAHVDVPTATLTSDAFGRSRGRSIRRDRARQGPVRAAELESQETTHFSIADADGNVLAVTSTIEFPFGSAVVVPGRGFFLNNELTDFDAYPTDGRGRPSANRAAPGKRPRSSMSPTLVFRDGNPVLAAGSPGGSRIIGITTHVVLNVLDWDMNVQRAVNVPRVLDRGGAKSELESLYFDDDMLERVMGVRDVVERLTELGHRVSAPPKGTRAVGGVHAIRYRTDGSLAGAADPRREGLALGVD